MPDVQPFLGRLRPWVFVMTAALGSFSAHAALFGDDEARRAILELRQQRTLDKEAHAALSAQVDQLKRGLLEMNGQVEQLRADLARQRGQEELLLRDVAELQRRLKDAQTAQEERLRQLEPQTVAVDGKTFKAQAEEKRWFEEALAHLRAADFATGAAGLNKLLQNHPQTGYRSRPGTGWATRTMDCGPTSLPSSRSRSWPIRPRTMPVPPKPCCPLATATWSSRTTPAPARCWSS